MGDPRGGVRHVIPGKGNYLAADSIRGHFTDIKAPGANRGLILESLNP